MFEGALDQAVVAHIPGARILRVHALTGGVSAHVYRLEIEASDRPSQNIVLRVHGPRHNGHPAALEAEVLRAVTKLGICAPRVLTVDDSLQHLPYPFLMLDHIDGEKAVPTSPADGRISVTAKTLARIHALPMPSVPGLPMRVDPLPELFDYLPKDKAFDALRQKLSRMDATRYTGVPALLHGDFWPGNLLWTDEHEVTGAQPEDVSRCHQILLGFSGAFQSCRCRRRKERA